jgi:hypothetical protein
MSGIGLSFRIGCSTGRLSWVESTVHSELLDTNRNGAVPALNTTAELGRKDAWKLRFVSYVVLTVCLAAGTLAVPWGLQVTILPAAIVFGWSQSGGL